MHIITLNRRVSYFRGIKSGTKLYPGRPPVVIILIGIWSADEGGSPAQTELTVVFFSPCRAFSLPNPISIRSRWHKRDTASQLCTPKIKITTPQVSLACPYNTYQCQQIAAMPISAAAISCKAFLMERF